MDVDPLADTVPPRYAIESDEEEDEYNPLRSSSEPNQVADVKVIGELPQERNIVVATGDVAKYWARGANLGEQSGAVAVNNIQVCKVGLVFNPEWTNATVIISEALTKLPVWAMHDYASTILDALKPPKVSLLDTYPVPSYIADKPPSFQDAPLRYLATSTIDPAIKSKADAFSPPNLIQSTSASFLSLLSTSHHSSNATLILVPSPHIPHPSPRELAPSNFLHLSEDRFEWSQDTINTAQQLVFLSIGEQPLPPWVSGKGASGLKSSRRHIEAGEGGMYI
ncbi:hypothetical protein Hypma_005282 [Hypsizygus marmoreus]|uniref:Uncharacterized protein n=1 Tax=Hypsizygus marmoreus TaxID=39966 RepID=A0A369JWH6_HYPMA|nr:hypothetical protein Hypma_005282 [Hypsizygus marmoreus]